MGICMQFTNKADLPKPVENFLKFSDYNASGVKFDISATRLIDSPNIAKLWSEHGKEVSEDVSDRLWSAVGSGIHKRFEDANSWDPDVIMEKRFVSCTIWRMTRGSITIYQKILLIRKCCWI